MPEFYHYGEWSKIDSFPFLLFSKSTAIKTDCRCQSVPNINMGKFYANEHGHTFVASGWDRGYCGLCTVQNTSTWALGFRRETPSASRSAGRPVITARAWPSWSLVFFFLSLRIKQKEVSLWALIEAFEWSAEVAMGWMNSIKIGPKCEIIIERIPLETKAT